MSTAVINLVTGINGSGKTLFLLSEVEKQAKEENRKVFFWGLRGVREAGILNWQEIEPMDDTGLRLGMENPAAIHNVENGAIIVIDEAHAVFPAGAKDPAQHIKDLATSRWRGHTIWLITQNGKALHTFCRDRVGAHHHMRRVWGMERATRYTWEDYRDVSSTSARNDAIKTEFNFPKEVYTWYKSADEHTVKRKVPWKKLSVIAWGPLLILGIAYWVWQRLQTGQPQAEEQPASAEAPQAPAAPVDPARAWAVSYKEVIPGLPHSAPVFDSVFRVRSYPKISGCSHIVTPAADRCSCNTQQGSRIQTISHGQCIAFLRDGWFDAGESDRREAPQEAAIPDQPSILGPSA